MIAALLFWYAILGIAFGMFITYAVLKKFGSWKEVCNDFNMKVPLEDAGAPNKLSPKVAMVAIPIMYMVVFSVAWMPFLIYIGSRKE